MSLYQQGLTLKALLEDPNLLNPPAKSKDGSKKEKDLDADLNPFSGQSAFLGPTLWDKTLPVTDNFELEYLDLENFLEENGISDLGLPLPGADVPTLPSVGHNSTPSVGGLSPLHVHLPVAASPQPISPAGSSVADLVNPQAIFSSYSPDEEGLVSPQSSAPSSPERLTDSQFQLQDDDLHLAQVPGEAKFDPCRRSFTDEELRPQPMIKKSRKIFVPEDLKDVKYWNRRNKNNVAAKRSRDARRIKENQIALRAAFLEKTCGNLKMELKAARRENEQLQRQLAKYEQP